MAGSIPLDRLIGQPNILAYQANQQTLSQIDRTGLYDFLKLNYSATFTLAGYTTLPVMVGSNAQEQANNMIQNVTLTATGNAAGAASDTICNTDFWTLAAYQAMYSGTVNATVSSAGTIANAAFNVASTTKIPFVDPWSNKPTMTRLDARLLSTLNLSISWRDATSFVSGGVAGTTAVSNAQCVISVREWQNTAQIGRPWMRLQDRKQTITAQQNALLVQGVPIGNVIRRQLLQGIVPQVTGYNYGWTSTAAFGSTGQAQGPMNALIINNSTQILNESLANLTADNAQLLNLPSAFWGALGWFVYEPARQKKTSQSIPMWGINRADNKIDVAAPGSFGSYLKYTDIEIVGATPAQLA